MLFSDHNRESTLIHFKKAGDFMQKFKEKVEELGGHKEKSVSLSSGFYGYRLRILWFTRQEMLDMKY